MPSIAFSTKTDWDHEKVEEFADIVSKDELPRSIPTNKDEFKVSGQGTYSYDGILTFCVS